MNNLPPSQTSFVPSGHGQPSGYGQPGGYEQPGYAAAASPVGYPPAGGYGEPAYGLPGGLPPGLPPGFPPGMYPPGYNPWLGTFAGPRYASVWSRIGSYLIDGIILGIFNGIAQIFFVGVTGSALVGGNTGNELTALLAFFILIFVLDAVYFVSQEAAYGQTIGKRALGIKVVKADGSPMDVDAALIRYVFLFFAFLGLGGLVTLLMIALSDTKQRLGDRVAGTIVVKAD